MIDLPKEFIALFPGQGSQYVGMGKKLCKKSRTADEIFNRANEILNLDIKKICFDGDENELRKTEICQPAVLTVSIAYYRTFIEYYNIEPIAAAGHSLGEYAALTASGCLSFEDSLKIVKKRGEYMQAAAEEMNGSMCAVIGSDSQTIKDVLDSYKGRNIYIANYNSPRQTVLSGSRQDIEEISKVFESKGIRSIELNVGGAFHSPLMKTAGDKLEFILDKYKFNKFKFPVMSNVSARPHRLESIKEKLKMQVCTSVKWNESINYLLTNNPEDIFIEFGPKSVLKNLNKNINLNLKKNTFAIEDDNEIISLYFNEKNIINNSKINKIKKCYDAIICTRNKVCPTEKYEQYIIKNADIIKKIYQLCKNGEQTISEDDIREAIVITKEILKAKGMNRNEWNLQLKEILS